VQEERRKTIFLKLQVCKCVTAWGGIDAQALKKLYVSFEEESYSCRALWQKRPGSNSKDTTKAIRGADQ